MKLTKEEKQELKGYIKFEDGVISNQEQLEKKFIDFMNKKYRTKYKQNDDKYEYIISQLPPDSDGEVKRLVMEDNEFYERTSVILYQESTKHYRSLGIKTKNDSYNIEVIGSHDIGQKRQYLEFYQLHGQKIYIDKVSLSDTREDQTISYQCEQIYAKDFVEKERAMDEAINNLFDKYHKSDNKNEILYRLLVNLNKEQLDYFSYEALVYFLTIELRNYHILPNQKRIIERILLAGDVPDAQQKKILRRALKINKKK